MLSLLQDSLEQFAVEVGCRVALAFLEEEVHEVCGPRYQRCARRTATRYGRQGGYVCLGGQKIPVQRPRVRSTVGEGEVRLPLYEKLQEPNVLPQGFLRRMVRGVSCRDYEGVIDLAADGFGVKKSSVSRGFVRASAQSLKEWMRRSLAGRRFVAIFIDGVEYAEETLIVALGLAEDGTKHVLGLRQGATENAAVATALLEDLVERGLDTSQPTLFVLDGAKALRTAVKRVFGRCAVIQRCQVHKKRNVKAHLAEKYHAELEQRLSEAYSETDYRRARMMLFDTLRWLARISPDAAKSLEEGMDETLTLVRLGVPATLRRTLSSTNAVESALSTVQRLTSRVKSWRPGNMRLRWCAAGLRRAQERFNRVGGYRQIPQLLAALDAAQLDAKPQAG
jgi:transposase-like protein